MESKYTEEIENLALHLKSCKNEYILLIGAGVSLESSVPLPNDIIKNIIQRKTGESIESVDEWMIDRYGEILNFPILLEKIGYTSEQRSDILNNYFKNKSPSSSHRMISKLVENGYIKFIITTNFDKLIEESCSKIKSIITKDQFSHFRPNQTQPAILKINGDYDYGNIKVTKKDLESYDGYVERHLEELIRDNYLICCGWSGVYDVRLSELIKRNFNRKPAYIVNPKPEKGILDNLFTHGYQLITLKSSEFFNILYEKLGIATDFSNLPSFFSKMLGRDEKLKEIDLALEDNKVINVNGITGVGKTRLVSEYAQKCIRKYDSICYVSLNKDDSEDIIFQKLYQIITNQQENSENLPIQILKKQIQKYIVGKNVLIILDNCEFDGILLKNIYTCFTQNATKLIFVSQKELNIHGLKSVQLEDLNFPEIVLTQVDEINKYPAVEMFFYLSNLETNTANIASVCHICKLVQGNPLAIEIISSLCKYKSINDIENELNTILLTASNPDYSEERHLNIKRAFEYCLNNLNKNEQEILLFSCLFVGGIDLDILKENLTLYETENWFKIFQALIDHKLLNVDKKLNRYNMHSLLRYYCYERLKYADSLNLLDDFIDIFHNLALKLFRTQNAEFRKNLQIFKREFENFKHAIHLSRCSDNSYKGLNTFSCLEVYLTTVGENKYALDQYEYYIDKLSNTNLDKKIKPDFYVKAAGHALNIAQTEKSLKYIDLSISIIDEMEADENTIAIRLFAYLIYKRYYGLIGDKINENKYIELIIHYPLSHRNILFSVLDCFCSQYFRLDNAIILEKIRDIEIFINKSFNKEEENSCDYKLAMAYLHGTKSLYYFKISDFEESKKYRKLEANIYQELGFNKNYSESLRELAKLESKIGNSESANSIFEQSIKISLENSNFLNIAFTKFEYTIHKQKYDPENTNEIRLLLIDSTIIFITYKIYIEALKNLYILSEILEKYRQYGKLAVITFVILSIETKYKLYPSLETYTILQQRIKRVIGSISEEEYKKISKEWFHAVDSKIIEYLVDLNQTTDT